MRGSGLKLEALSLNWLADDQSIGLSVNKQ